MSILCKVEGTSTSNKGISLKKLLKEVLPDLDICVYSGSDMNSFSFTFVADSHYASYCVKNFIEALNNKNVSYDLTSFVRWIN